MISDWGEKIHVLWLYLGCIESIYESCSSTRGSFQSISACQVWTKNKHTITKTDYIDSNKVSFLVISYNPHVMNIYLLESASPNMRKLLMNPIIPDVDSTLTFNSIRHVPAINRRSREKLRFGTTFYRHENMDWLEMPLLYNWIYLQIWCD